MSFDTSTLSLSLCIDGYSLRERASAATEQGVGRPGEELECRTGSSEYVARLGIVIYDPEAVARPGDGRPTWHAGRRGRLVYGDETPSQAPRPTEALPAARADAHWTRGMHSLPLPHAGMPRVRLPLRVDCQVTRGDHLLRP